MSETPKSPEEEAKEREAWEKSLTAGSLPSWWKPEQGEHGADGGAAQAPAAPAPPAQPAAQPPPAQPTAGPPASEQKPLVQSAPPDWEGSRTSGALPTWWKPEEEAGPPAVTPPAAAPPTAMSPPATAAPAPPAAAAPAPPAAAAPGPPPAAAPVPPAAAAPAPPAVAPPAVTMTSPATVVPAPAAPAARESDDSTATVHMPNPVGGPAVPVPAPPAPVGSEGQRTMVMGTYQAPQPRAQLTVRSGPDAGTRFTLGAEIAYLGRAKDNHLVVNDAATSRRHARFEQRDSKFILVDLGSANGSAIDGVRVALEQPLTNGCKIAIGQNVIEVAIS